MDPVTVEVIRNAFPAISSEMVNTVQRAAYSQFIYEVKDFALGIFDPDGRLMSQSIATNAMFIADLGIVVKDGVRHFGLENIHPGDVFIQNHQKLTGHHLNHINIYTPFFFEGELVAMPIVRAHHLDVGGKAGGVSIDPWEEGLQIDHLKLYDRGVPDETALQLIRDNVRIPEHAVGDIRAEIAACRLAERRMEELFRRYGRDTVLACLEAIYDQSEARCRAVVERIPDGTYWAITWWDYDRLELDKMIPLPVTVEVKGSDLTVDLTGCYPQRRGPINTRSLAAPYIAYKALTTPLEHVNEGSFRALQVKIQEGNLMMARFPGPFAGWSSLLSSVVDCIFAALAPVLPQRVPAGSQGIIAGAGFGFNGQDPVTRKPFRFLDGQGAGWGARPYEDGVPAMCSITQGDVRNSPVEAMENKYPVRVDKRGLKEDSGGPGTFRGGLGLDLEATNLVDLYWNHDWTGRRKFPPQGFFGGKPGGTIHHFVRPAGARDFEEKFYLQQYWLRAGGSIRQWSSGGGGWGDPLDRDPQAVLRDLVDEYVTFESAQRDYGVVIDPVSLTVQEEPTRVMRAAMRSRPPS